MTIIARAPGIDGISLFLTEFDPAAAGLEVHAYRTVDDRGAAEVVLDGLRLPAAALLGDDGRALPSLEQVRDEGAVAICAEAVGCMRKVLADIVEYCEQRRQFGQPIGGFQELAIGDYVKRLTAIRYEFGSTTTSRGTPSRRRLSRGA